ncbi:hypothetical protein AAMO2058_000097700 [Amorphochlora amoebiformis]
MIFLFLVDTGASMNQMTTKGITMLDSAKGAIEHFIKIRTHDPNARQDQYLLVTCAEVVVGWGETINTFIEKVKSLRAYDKSSMAMALNRAFNLLNRFRMSGVDTYGFGRRPWFIEPSNIILLTDGQISDMEYSYQNQTQDPLERFVPSISARCLPGYKDDLFLSKSENRWDQRIFTIILRFPGIRDISMTQKAYRPHPVLRYTAEKSGGKILVVRNLRSLLQTMEQHISKLSPTFTCRFECVSDEGESKENGVIIFAEGDEGNDEKKDTTFSALNQIHFRVRAGHWPIPENFLPEGSSELPENSVDYLPPRETFPVLSFNLQNIAKPFDSMPSIPFDKYQLAQGPVAQFCAGRSSAKKANISCPVYVRNSMGGNTLDKPFGILACEGGVLKKSVPPYYHASLQNTLARTGLGLEHLQVKEYTLSGRIQRFLQREREASQYRVTHVSLAMVDDVRETRDPDALERYSKILRHRYLGTDTDMKCPILNNSKEHFGAHSRPISEMGNYVHALRSKLILRDPFSEDEDSNRRVNFGSRYKKEKSKKDMMFIDAVDEAADLVESLKGGKDSTRGAGRRRKRRVGRNRMKLASLENLLRRTSHTTQHDNESDSDDISSVSSQDSLLPTHSGVRGGDNGGGGEGKASISSSDAEGANFLENSLNSSKTTPPESHISIPPLSALPRGMTSEIRTPSRAGEGGGEMERRAVWKEKKFRALKRHAVILIAGTKTLIHQRNKRRKSNPGSKNGPPVETGRVRGRGVVWEALTTHGFDDDGSDIGLEFHRIIKESGANHGVDIDNHAP